MVIYSWIVWILVWILIHGNIVYGANILEGTQFIGCYEDNDPRAMVHDAGKFHRTLTNKLCIEKCQAEGITFAGTQYYYQCFCGESYDKYGIVRTQTDCNTYCDGDSSQTCGGGWKNSVYAVCPFGKFGVQCEKLCPTNCKHEPNAVCQFINGKCVYGCNTDHDGPYCDLHCKTLKGDPRTEVGSMNNVGGTFFNLFTTLTFPENTQVKGVQYYSQKSGRVYISFWRKDGTETNKWTMVDKIEIQSNSTVGPQEYLVKNRVIDVQAGDAVAVHYKAGDPGAVIPYEKSTMAQRTENIKDENLHDVINENIQDNDWQPGHTITHAPESRSKKTAAIKILYNCGEAVTCDPGKFGPNCLSGCLTKNCFNNVCHRYIGDECVEGCIAGKTGKHCDKECAGNTYGRNCKQICGHCKNNEQCDTSNGACPQRCAKGWRDPKCDKNCTSGTYGENCEQSCNANCLNSCERIEGHCNGGCKSGWMGLKCDQECPDRRYGIRCSEFCSTHCRNGEFCNKETGYCDNGCKPGYDNVRDKKCFTECNNGHYGYDCQACSLHCQNGCIKMTVFGDCIGGCSNGYEGLNCTKPCGLGKYGQNCLNTCSSNCLTSGDCEAMYGTCSGGCKAGFEGLICSQSCSPETYDRNCEKNCSKNCKSHKPICHAVNGTCLAGCEGTWLGARCDSRCPNGKYGSDCSETCGHCANGVGCNYVTGVCPDKKCASGYTTDYCSVLKIQDPSINGGLIGGVIVALLVLVALGVIIGIILSRKKRSQAPYYYENDQSMPINTGNLGDDAKSLNGKQVQAEPFTSKTLEKPVVPVKPTMKPSDVYINVDESDPEPRVTLINVSDIGTYIAKQMKQKEPFADEYHGIRKDKLDSWEYSGQEKLKPKNRYKNIMPYDKNRVKLSVVNGDPLSDYINASFIQDYTGRKAFIASHGPTNATIEDFWRMIWEHKVELVVMLTNLVEETKVKCLQYWPNVGTEEHTGITVKKEPSEAYSEYEVRHFTLKKGEEIRKLVQYHYTGWPDHGVPPSAAGLWAIRDKVKAYKSKHDEPVIVHCSAGVGRTGTFISMDILHDEVDAHGKIDVHACIDKLRNQRISMVQTLDQYIFIYNAMREITLLGKTAIMCRNFELSLGNLQKSSESEKSIMDKQFEFLETIKPRFKEDELETAMSEENKKKNYDMNILPAEKHRIILPSAPNDYINAVFVGGYRKKNKYIATHIPLTDDDEDIWRIIMYYKCSSVVILGEPSAGNKWFPSFNQSKECGPYVISHDDQTKKMGVIQQNLIIREQSEDSMTEYANVDPPKFQLKIFSTSKWTGNSLTDNSPDIVTDIYTEVQKWQKKTSDHSIVVMCKNGATECGMFIGSCYLNDMANSEQSVDVFNVVKDIKRTRPQLIGSKEEYNYLHLAVSEYLSGFEDYGNMK